MKKEIKTNIILLAIIIIFLVSQFISPNVTISPDENTRIFFSSNIIKNQGFSSPTNLPESFGDLIHPRTAVNINGNVTPLKSLGLYILEGGIYTIIQNQVAFPTLDLIYGLITIIFIYLFAFNLSKSKRISLLVSAIFSITPLPEVLSIAPVFMFISIFYFYKSLKEQNIGRYVILFNLFFWIAIIARYELIIPYVLFFLVLSIYRKVKIREIFFYSFIISLVFSLIILILNNAIYGNPFFIGYNFDLQSSSTGAFGTSLSPHKVLDYLFPFGFNVSSLISVSLRFLFYFIPLSTIIYIFILVKLFDKKPLRPIILTFILLSAWMIFYYGNNPDFFDSSRLIDSSYVRYLLVIYIGLFVFFSLYLKEELLYKIPKKLVLFMIFSFVTIMILIYTTNYFYLDNQKKGYELLKDKILEITPNNSIIFTSKWDKVLWSNRLTATSSVNFNENQIKDLIEKNYNQYEFYIFQDSLYYDTLKNNSPFIIEPLGGTGLYRVVLKNDSTP